MGSESSHLVERSDHGRGPVPPVGAHYTHVQDSGLYPDFYRFRVGVVEGPGTKNWPRTVEVEMHRRELYIMSLCSSPGPRVICRLAYTNIQQWEHSPHVLELKVLSGEEVVTFRFSTKQASGIVASLKSVVDRIIADRLIAKQDKAEAERRLQHEQIVEDAERKAIEAKLQAVARQREAEEVDRFFNGV